MTRHSKNSTAGAFFTSAERDKLDYGTRAQRIGRDSMRPFYICSVCLQEARTPVVCERGHLACRECVLQALVHQRQQLAEQQRRYHEELARRNAHETQQKQTLERKRIAQFEQQAFGTADYVPSQVDQGKRAKTDSAFWLPSKTPSAKEELRPVSKETFCPAAKHTLTSKQIHPVKWTRNAQQEHICIICSRPLSNAVPMAMIKTCGHVACLGCFEKFSPTTKQSLESCPACSTSYTKSQHLITLSREGTGFVAGGGQVLATKYDHAFA